MQLQNLQNDCVVWSSTIASQPGRCSFVLLGHSGVVVRRSVLLATLKVCKTFQPPRCESGLSAFEAAVDVLSDAQVYPSGKSVVYHMSS